MKKIMSCNGCRVLRKGCSDDCTLRPCLDWIQSPVSQANATLFLAKFYGRAGLINLINSGTTHLRPAIFRSLIYEACGRIIDPVHGSIGLMSSGNWPRCEAAFQAVLNGSPLPVQGLSNEETSSDHVQHPIALLQRCDIRHLSKPSATSHHRVRTPHVKRTKCQHDYDAKFTITGWELGEDEKELNRVPSRDSFTSELVNRENKPIWGVKPEICTDIEIGLELTLGFNPVLQTYLSTVIEISDSDEA